MLSDWEYGPHGYKNVKQLESWINTAFSNSRTDIEELFTHVYVYTTTWNGNAQAPEWYDAGLTYNEILSDFKAKYRKRLVVEPYYFCSDEGNEVSEEDLIDKVKMVIDLYKPKYKKMVELIGLKYDPLKNTNIKHTGTDKWEETGKKTRSRTVDLKNGATFMEISGPLHMKGEDGELITTAALNTNPPAGTNPPQELNLVFEAKPTIETNGQSGSTTSQGKQGGVSNNTTTLSDGTGMATKSYDGPYDNTETPNNSSNAILSNVVVSEGDVGTVEATHDSVSTFVNGRATFGNPGAFDYTDTEEADTTRKPTKTRTPNLTDEGYANINIADVIEGQKKALRFSVIEEFFRDLAKEILLSAWG